MLQKLKTLCRLETNCRVEWHVIQGVLRQRGAAVQCVDNGAVAGVDTNVGSAGVERNDVASLKVRVSNRGALCSLSLGGTWDGLANLAVCP